MEEKEEEINNQEEEENINKSEEIICPICKKITFIDASSYKLNFLGKNCGHTIRNILLKDYEKTQIIDISCQKCKEKYKNNQEFWICLKCNINLCTKCKDTHEKENENKHKIIEYNLKDFICNNHYEKYSKYCLQCKKNICEKCKDHSQHNPIGYEKIEYLNQELKGSIDKLKTEINKIKQKLDNILENLEIYYKINENLYKNKYRDYKNYEALMNIKQINKFNKMIKEDIEKIEEEKNINKKFENLMNIYEKINSNYISGKIKINKENINKDIRILNSFEEYKRKNKKKMKKMIINIKMKKKLKLL